MRISAIFLIVISAAAAGAQDSASTAPHVATRSTPIRTAPVTGSTVTPAVGQLAKGATVDIIARDRDWVRVRLEGWVREADLTIFDSTLRPLSAADIRSDPEGSRGKLVQWHVEAVALQTADPLRTGLQAGEQYLLALGPGPEKMLVYLAVPESLLPVARTLPALAPVTITARVRNGRSEPAGVPILDLQSLTKR
ncbi:MAG TPA: SH3 domain-containing protein [Gemmatimonadaceae bacterium]